MACEAEAAAVTTTANAAFFATVAFLAAASGLELATTAKAQAQTNYDNALAAKQTADAAALAATQALDACLNG